MTLYKFGLQVADVCVGALNALFKNDEVGDVSLEVIEPTFKLQVAYCVIPINVNLN